MSARLDGRVRVRLAGDEREQRLVHARGADGVRKQPRRVRARVRAAAHDRAQHLHRLARHLNRHRRLLWQPSLMFLWQSKD